MINQNSIKNLLQHKNITQKSLAESLGLDPINFNKIVNNKRGIDHALAKKIADILDVQWFQVYEPMNTEIEINGYYDGSKLDNSVNLFDPIMDKKYPNIILKNYIADVQNIISIIDKGSCGLFIMLKDQITDVMTLNGIYYAKLKNGSTKFIAKMYNGMMEVSPNVAIEKKLLRQKPKLDYCIPVSRIDYDWVWLNKGVPSTDPYPFTTE